MKGVYKYINSILIYKFIMCLSFTANYTQWDSWYLIL